MKPIRILTFLCVLLSSLQLRAVHSESGTDPHALFISVEDYIPILILGGEWTSSIVISNYSGLPLELPLKFYTKGGPWTVRVKGKGTGSAFTYSLPIAATVKIEFEGLGTTAEVGWAELDVFECTPSFSPCLEIGAYALLRNHNPLRAQDFEVSYQALGRSNEHVFLFDQTAFSQMVLNLINACTFSFCSDSTVALSVLDENGQAIYSRVETIAPMEVKILNLAQLSMTTWNRLGTIRVVSSGFDLVVSGHRINETGSFTPLTPFSR